ncbi:sialic acid-binding Ig-like lectin 11 [Canis lupus dingo]|uniref:sialic acid-binding Ig-like lectin 11 n=1 Tax=Canis lupus dingo TaxID=286419 RepID=UPI000DC683B4|nr:sialic acid-binding Ig-like lectin 11 [Canis lupus dingo]
MLVLLLSLLWAWSLQEDPGYELHVQDSVTVQEGLCVRVPCTVSYPQVGRHSATPAYGSWFRIKGNPKGEVLMATNKPARETKRKIKLPFHLSGDPGAGDCSLSITDARREHSGHYYFHLDRGPMKHSYRSNMLIVSVRELTQAPDIWVKEPLESGCLSHLTCSVLGACDGVLAPTISWTGPALKPSGLGLEAYNSSEILLIPRPQDHGTNLTCRVTFKAGMSTQSTITLNVSYAPQNLGISISRENCTELKYPGNGSSLHVLEGESLFLLCAADSNPPAELSWFRGSPALNATPIYRSPILDLPQVGVSEQGDFTCRAQNSLGSQHVSLHLSVVYPPRPLSPSCSWEGEALQCTCSSHARPAPTLRWRLGEGLLERNHSNASLTVTSSAEGPWANSSLSLRGPLGSGLRLSCEAWNAHGKQSATVLLLPGKPEHGGGFLLGAVGGAGVAGLLSLCPCLIFFIVKTCRKQAPEPTVGGKDAACMLGPLSWGYKHECPLGASMPLAHPPAAVGVPTLEEEEEEEEELHYASFTFQGLRPWKPQDPEGTSVTEYSEIKIWK